MLNEKTGKRVIRRGVVKTQCAQALTLRWIALRQAVKEGVTLLSCFVTCTVPSNLKVAFIS